jgi:NitT/TauT family transport system ATP-binding protein
LIVDSGALRMGGNGRADADRPKVVIENVGMTFVDPALGTVTALDGIDLALQDGEFLSIVGPSGCGKSTLLKLISGLLPPTSGRVLVEDVEVREPPPGVGFMFQRDALLPWATVADNIAVGLELSGAPAAERRAKVAELIDFLGLKGFERHYPAALSGGMRQRVSLGRILAYAPTVYLMDEPFGALDAQTKLAMGRELLRIWSTYQRSIIFVTHDIEEAVGLSDRVVVMSGRPGRIRAEYVVDIPRPRDIRQIRLSGRFREICDGIWADLME